LISKVLLVLTRQSSSCLGPALLGLRTKSEQGDRRKDYLDATDLELTQAGELNPHARHFRG
jgi:hypothetical protein